MSSDPDAILLQVRPHRTLTSSSYKPHSILPHHIAELQLQVEGKITMQNVSVYLTIGDVFEDEESKNKYPLAKSERFSGTFATILDNKYTDRILTITHEYVLHPSLSHFSLHQEESFRITLILCIRGR